MSIEDQLQAVAKKMRETNVYLNDAHTMLVQHEKALQLCAETLEGARITILDMQKRIARQDKEINEIFTWVKTKLK